MSILFYTYQAACHCVECARASVGAELDNPDHVFGDGTTVYPVFSTDAHEWTEGATCDDCGRKLIEAQPDRGAWA